MCPWPTTGEIADLWACTSGRTCCGSWSCAACCSSPRCCCCCCCCCPSSSSCVVGVGEYEGPDLAPCVCPGVAAIWAASGLACGDSGTGSEAPPGRGLSRGARRCCSSAATAGDDEEETIELGPGTRVRCRLLLRDPAAAASVRPRCDACRLLRG